MNEDQNGTPNPYDPNNGMHPNGGGYPSGGYGTGGYQNIGGYRGTGGYQNVGGYQVAGGYQNTGYGMNGGMNAGYGNNSNWAANQPVYSVDQMAAPVPIAPESGGKKRVGLVVGMVAAVLILVGVLVAVTMLPSGESPKDPVSAAVSKLLSENAPEGIAIDGKVSLTSGDNKAFVQNAELKVKSELVTESWINSTVVGLNMKLGTGGDIALKLSENYGGEGDVFIKIDGARVALQNQTTTTNKSRTNNTRTSGNTEEIEASEEYLKCLSDIDSGADCKDLLDDGTAEANNLASLAALTTMLQTLSSVDGEWIRVPVSSLNSTTTAGLVGNGDTSQCTANLAEDIRNNRTSLAELYDNNSFIYSKIVSQDDDGLSDLDKKAMSALLLGSNGETDEDKEEVEGAGNEEGTSQTLIYQVMFDEETLKSFVKAMMESETLKNTVTCLGGGEDDAEANAEKAAELIKSLPKIFVTLDDSLNFAKVYFGLAPDTKSSVVAGMDLSYPENITVTKPGNYKDLSAVMQNLPENLNN